MRLAVWLSLVVLALLLGHSAIAAEDFLEPDKAFRFSARALDERSVEVSFEIAPGYYLYREQFRFEAVGARLDAPALPVGKSKFDETFRKNVETYRDTVRVVVPVERANGAFRLTTTSQGCADAGLCYPPMTSVASVSLTAYGGSGEVRTLPADEVAATPPVGASVGLGGIGPSTSASLSTSRSTSTSTSPSPSPSIDKALGRADSGPLAERAAGAAPSLSMPTNESAAIQSVLRNGSFWSVVGAFFVAGVLLSFTPCVLPMLPIVSSIIVGQGASGASATNAAAGVSRGRGLALAAAYSFGMALVYTALGIGAGLAGEGLAATLQNPWVLGLFAVALVVLSLSMFGVYELQMPAAWSSRFHTAADRLPAGRVVSVAAMGGVSALIVSPCVAAPLAGALLYLSQTQNVVLGGTALFSLAAGMSVPLLLVGASAGAWLPRTGAWMVEVKAAFGLLLLGVALWTVESVLPPSLGLALWGLLAGACAALLLSRAGSSGGGSAPGEAGSGRIWRRGLAALFGLVGVLEIVGAAAGSVDPLQPLASLATSSRGAENAAAGPGFAIVRSVAELDAVLSTAKRPVMLDFYADWCVSCKEMERFTFSDPAVRARLSGATLLKADVTANSADDRALLKRFHLFGPPGTLFFDRSGQEIDAARLVGFQSSARFLDTLRAAGI